MSKAITIIHYSEDKDHFLTLLNKACLGKASDLITPNQFIYENKYHEAIEGDSFKNLSFIIMDDVVGEGDPLAIILIHKIHDIFCYTHLGIQMTLIDERKKIVSQAFEIIFEISKKHSIQTIKIDDRGQKKDLSMIGAEAFNYNGVPHSKLEAIVDLTKTEDDLHRDLRKSYKSLINQGRREINFDSINAQNPDRDKFNQFQSFHKQVAGRITRPQQSWDIQFDMIKAGQAELIMGSMSPHGLVSSALFNDVGAVTQYSVAVYNRDLFDYPLAHANLYEGMLRAKKRGQKTFYLGQIPAFGTVSEKEFNIGKFKKGFCENIKSYIEWEIIL